MKNGDRTCKRFLLISVVVPWPATIALGQSQSASTQSSQSSQQSSSQAQARPQQKEESTPDEAKKAQKEKAKPKKVYTEEDLSGMRSNGVSVVGDDARADTGPAGTKKAEGKTKTAVVPMSGQDEEYWRGKARVLLDQIAAREQQIAKLKDDIKRYGPGGIDVTTGMKDNVAYVEDRNAQVKELEKRKADLEKNLDQLQELGRKAGAPPAWFR